jgi:hypothetical protein
MVGEWIRTEDERAPRDLTFPTECHCNMVFDDGGTHTINYSTDDVIVNNSTMLNIAAPGVLLSLGPVEDKYWFADEARVIAEELNLPIYATGGTADMLAEIGIACTPVGKGSNDTLSGLRIIDDGKVDLVINIPREYDEQGRPDGYLIRRRAVDTGVALITDLQLARAVIEAIRWHKPDSLQLVALNDYFSHGTTKIL